MKPSGVMTTPLPPPTARRPPRTRRETRRFATDGESRSAMVMTAREYASSASSSATSSEEMNVRSAIRSRYRTRTGLPRKGMAEVESTRDGAVLTIALNRPDKLNAFDAATHKAFAGAPEGGGRRRGAGRRPHRCRPRLLRRAGPRASCARASATSPRCFGSAGTATCSGCGGWRSRCSPPSTARPPARGFRSRCACDLRIAADSAAFVPAFVNVGLVPDTGGSWLVPRLLGYARAFEWMCSGRKIGADEALAWGLVSEVVPADGVLARAQERGGRASPRFRRRRSR